MKCMLAFKYALSHGKIYCGSQSWRKLTVSSAEAITFQSLLRLEWSPFLLRSEKMRDVILWRSCTGNYSSYELVSSEVWSHLKDSVSPVAPPPPLTSGSYRLSAPFPIMVPQHLGKEVWVFKWLNILINFIHVYCACSLHQLPSFFHFLSYLPLSPSHLLL